MDWRNPKNDRARAAYDNFAGLDGKFDGNVVIQIKNGPIDFQVREPASPLFGALERTSEAIELQITQEYTGQQRHLCYLVPMWKETLDFDLRARPAGQTPVKALVAGNVFHQPHGGFIGVHYGPGIESSERNGWGQWHRADQEGIGMDRTTATGTGFVGQYSPVVAGRYESLKTCPDELLLFFCGCSAIKAMMESRAFAARLISISFNNLF